MTNRKLGTLAGTWPFTCSVIMVDYELPGYAPKGQDVAGVHSGRFFRMRIRVEEKYKHAISFPDFIHHEHKHAIDKSSLRYFLLSFRKREDRAEAYTLTKTEAPVPWLSKADIRSRYIARWVIVLSVLGTLVYTVY